MPPGIAGRMRSERRVGLSQYNFGRRCFTQVSMVTNSVVDGDPWGIIVHVGVVSQRCQRRYNVL